MSTYSSKTNLFTYLLAPSGLSLLVCAGGAVLLLFAKASHTLGTGASFYRLLLGDEASGNLVLLTRQDFSNAVMFFDRPLINNVLLFGFWALVGILVWFLLTNTSLLFGEIGDDLEEVNHSPAEGLHPFVRTGQKVGFQLAMLFVTFAYIYILKVIFLDLITDFFISGLGLNWTIPGVLTMFLAAIVLTLAFHVLTVLFRLLFLRPRLLGD
ncbi:MAG TPA: hypothetical protein VLG25_00985 [Patescibacteria group bacterium]|nr:hypothetical protein [Patescibacteria group bacterium]